MELAKFKPFLVGLGIFFGAIAVVVALQSLKPKTEKEETTKPPLMVKTVEAAHKEQIVFANFQGEVRAKTEIELVTQVTGKVMSVSEKFIEGGEFKAGEVLLQIDDADYQVALKSAKASVASAQVDLDIELATAATNAREWQDLQGKPISEANPLRLNKPQIDRANARLDAAKAELAAARLNYNRTKISAPFDGRIMAKSAELGQFLSRGSSIGRVFATDTMEVRIPMTDVQISELGLRLGYSARAEGSEGLPTTVSTVFGTEQRLWNGFLRSVDASVDSTTRLLFATVVVDKPFEQNETESMPLIPGLFVDIQLASPSKLIGIQVPRTALRNGNQVYVYDQEKLRLKTVKPVFTSTEMVIVSDAEGAELALGELVITSPVPGAHDGMAIKLPETLKGESEQIAEDASENSPKINDVEVSDADISSSEENVLNEGILEASVKDDSGVEGGADEESAPGENDEGATAEGSTTGNSVTAEQG